MEKATHGYHFVVQQEMLWWLKVQRNMLAMAAGGGNILILDVTGGSGGEVKIGDLVRHTGGNNGTVGWDGPGYVYGFVKERQTETRMLVQLCGPVTGKWSGSAAGNLVYVDEDDTSVLRGAPAVDVESRAVVGVAMGVDGSSPKGIMSGLGMEASLMNYISPAFVNYGAGSGTALVFNFAKIKLPSLTVLEPSAKEVKATATDRELSVSFKRGVSPSMPFVGLVNTVGAFRADYRLSGSSVIVKFFKNDTIEVKPSEMSGELHVILMGGGNPK